MEAEPPRGGPPPGPGAPPGPGPGAGPGAGAGPEGLEWRPVPGAAPAGPAPGGRFWAAPPLWALLAGDAEAAAGLRATSRLPPRLEVFRGYLAWRPDPPPPPPRAGAAALPPPPPPPREGARLASPAETDDPVLWGGAHSAHLRSGWLSRVPALTAPSSRAGASS